MTKEQLWTCDRCGESVTGDDMKDVWKPYKIGREVGHLCPDCFPTVEAAIEHAMNTGDSGE